MRREEVTLEKSTLEVSHLTVRPGHWDIVHDISFQAKQGEVTALLGPNGAGKTTLLRGILGLQKISSGSVEIIPEHEVGKMSVVDLNEISEMQRARLMAYVPQHSRLSARLSARAMVELGRFPHRGNSLGLSEMDHEIVDRALADTDCIYLNDRSFSDCSGGEQARLLVARALATEAPFLLLDEPAANLDISHSLELFHLLRNLADQGKAVLVVMHQLEHALKWADRSLLMNASRAIAWGISQEVLSSERIEKVYGVRMIENTSPSYERIDRPPEHETRCVP